MSTVIQFQVENYEDFKNEIINGVINQIKDLGINNKQVEEKPNQLISRKETSELLNISLVKLWSITKDGLLVKYKIGKKVLYKKSEVESFINSQNNF